MRSPRRGRLRTVDWTRVSRGLYRRRSRGSNGTDEPAWVADLGAWALVLPPSSAITHLTAAALYEWWLPPLPADVPIFATVPRSGSRPRRSGLVVSRPDVPVRLSSRYGLPVVPAAEGLLQAARDLGVLDTVVLVDAALHDGDCDLADLRELAGTRRAGAPNLRRAIALADGRAESAWESLLRVFHVLCKVPVEPQYEVRDDLGRFLARGDLRIAGTRVLHEYDGAVHRDRWAHRRDLARDRELLSARWQRRGYTSGDLLTGAHRILREADEALGRPHRPERLRPWFAALNGSLFTVAGTARIRTRWNLPLQGA